MTQNKKIETIEKASKLLLNNNKEDKEWDGLAKIFIELVEKGITLLSDIYIKRWYSISKSFTK